MDFNAGNSSTNRNFKAGDVQLWSWNFCLTYHVNSKTPRSKEIQSRCYNHKFTVHLYKKITEKMCLSRSKPLSQNEFYITESTEVLMWTNRNLLQLTRSPWSGALTVGTMLPPLIPHLCDTLTRHLTSSCRQKPHSRCSSAPHNPVWGNPIKPACTKWVQNPSGASLGLVNWPT